MSNDESKVKKFDDTKMKFGRADQYKQRLDTTKLRDMLREKCRIRIKESREKNFMISRNFLDSEKNWFTDILREGLKELDENIEWQEVIYHELVDEFSQWLADEWERELAYLAEAGLSEVTATCPICQVSELMLENTILSCSCGFKLNYNKTLKDYWNATQKVISEHENKCNCRMTFYTEPKNNSTEMVLNAFCKNCDYYAAVVN